KFEFAQLAAPFAIVSGALLSATAKRRKVRETIWIFAAGSTLAALSHGGVVAKCGESEGTVLTFVIYLTDGYLLLGQSYYVSRNRERIAARLLGRVISKSLPQEGQQGNDDEQ